MSLAADTVDKTLIVGSEEDFPPFAIGRTDGLRLSMVQRIVKKCGGRIWVESEGLNQKCNFRFTLPDALLREVAELVALTNNIQSQKVLHAFHE